MAETINIGGVQMTVGVDDSDLQKAEPRVAAAMKSMEDSTAPLKKQLEVVTDALRKTAAMTEEYASRISASHEEAGRSALKNLRSAQTQNTEFGLGLEGLIAIGDRVTASLRRMFGLSSGVNLFGQRVDVLGDNLRKFNLEGGQVTGMLHRVEGGFVQIQRSGADAAKGINGVTSAVKSLGEQAAPVERHVSSLVTGFGLLTGGAIVAGVSAVIASIKSYGDELVDLGQKARRSQMSLLEFQTAQQTLFVSGNLGAEEFARGVEAIAKNLNDANREENTLSKLLDANNIKWKDGHEVVISTNRALEVMSDLIRNARTEQDKIKVAEAFGVSKDFIPAVERGSEELRRLGDNVVETGGLIDSNLIAKAEKFSEKWRQWSTQALTWIKAFAFDAMTEVEKIVPQLFRITPEMQRDIDAIKKFFDNIGTSPEKIQAQNEAFDSLVTSAINSLTGLKNEAVRLWSETFGDEETKKAIAERKRAIDELRTAMSSMAEVNFEFQSFSPPVPKSKETNIPGGAEDKTAEHLKRRLEQVRQSIAEEDLAYEVQRQRYMTEVDKFEAAKLVKAEEAAAMRRQIDEKIDKQKQDYLFQNLELVTASEEEIMTRRHQRQLELVDQFERNRTITEERANENRKKMDEQYSTAKLQLMAKSYSGLASIVDTSMSAISQIVGDESQKGFTVMKAVSMATALVKGFEAAVSAYAFGAKIGGPPLGAAMAAVAAVGTGAIIAKLAGVGPSGGGGGGSGGGGGLGPIASGGGAAAASPVGEAPEVNRSLTVHGITSKELFSGGMVRDLAKALLDFQRDGGKVVFSS